MFSRHSSLGRRCFCVALQFVLLCCKTVSHMFPTCLGDDYGDDEEDDEDDEDQDEGEVGDLFGARV